MKKILYIPLDERPCNYSFPQYIAKTRSDVHLVVPPKEMLGNKKIPADVESLWEFVFEHVKKVNGIVISAEMLIYGGLLPSRLHQLSKEDVEERMLNFQYLRELNKCPPLYVSSLIMRTPQMSTSDEEPDYYAHYGLELFQRAYLIDKKKRVGLKREEEDELLQTNEKIPKYYIEDYEFRRAFNVQVNVRLLKLIEEGIIDFLSIPQDDSSLYGYTARDQTEVYGNIVSRRLQSKVMVYPGADEVGCTLIARMLNKLLDRKPSIYYLYSSTLGPDILPLYEDRPINESVKAHISAAGCTVTPTPEDADFILAINTPGKVMEEAAAQMKKDVSYSSYRQLHFFTEQMQKWVWSDKPVVLADSAFANGGDLEIITYLDDYQILDQLISYKGWNTNCNTLGTSIAAGVFGFEKQNKLEIQRNLLYHMFDDVFYQAQIRSRITEELLPSLGGNYFDLNGQDTIVAKEIQKQIVDLYQTTILQTFKHMIISEVQIFSPWSRMFEIGINLKVARADNRMGKR